MRPRKPSQTPPEGIREHKYLRAQPRRRADCRSQTTRKKDSGRRWRRQYRLSKFGEYNGLENQALWHRNSISRRRLTTARHVAVASSKSESWTENGTYPDFGRQGKFSFVRHNEFWANTSDFVPLPLLA